MRILLYYNMYGFAINVEGILDEVTYITTIQNMHKLIWKAQFFKSTYVSMLGHGCCVSQYPQFYDGIKIIK